MKTTPHPAASRSRRGNSLIEAIIAVGVLAVAVPLVFGTLAESGESSLASKAETRTSWVVPACLEELQAARDGLSRFLPPIPAGQKFDNVALAFGADGGPVGSVEPGAYASGIRDSGANSIRYIASMSAEPVSQEAGAAPMRQLRIRLEYPAAKRQKIDFFTRLP